MIDIRRDTKDKSRFILILGDKKWHIAKREVQRLYRRLKTFNLWQDEGLKSGIRHKIMKYREDHNMTQAELAKGLHVSKMQILRWEHGTASPSKLAIDVLKAQGVI